MSNHTLVPSPEPGCLYSIKSLYPKFSVKEKRIADHILANPSEAVHPSIDELAEKIGISESTLVRFVRKLGFSGYQRFRIALATEAVGPASRVYETDIAPEHDLIETVFANVFTTLSLTKSVQDRDSINRCVQLMHRARRVMLFGIGGSQIIALDAFHKFMRIGLECVVSEDFHMQLMLASQADRECVALVFSHTGMTMDTLAIAEELKRKGCPVIVVTSGARSTLARMADIVLPVAVAATGYISEAFTSRIAQQVVIDLLYIQLVNVIGEEAVDHIDSMREAIAKRKM